ncbi:hypothetical protein Ciccas_005885 [Cichlidogyrus casuarinus]|uniref:Beta-casein n=1 Tax=Cichlidogyrus casuarinus TaxID=1844966 RepID=A0ABD2Q7D7_9PLAT
MILSSALIACVLLVLQVHTLPIKLPTNGHYYIYPTPRRHPMRYHPKYQIFEHPVPLRVFNFQQKNQEKPAPGSITIDQTIPIPVSKMQPITPALIPLVKGSPLLNMFHVPGAVYESRQSQPVELEEVTPVEVIHEEKVVHEKKAAPLELPIEVIDEKMSAALPPKEFVELLPVAEIPVELPNFGSHNSGSSYVYSSFYNR